MNYVLKILILLISIGFAFVILKPRSINRMESIASKELTKHVHYSLVSELDGPLMVEEDEFADFIWYKALDWGDTSKIYIRVYKIPISYDNNGNLLNNFGAYTTPSITMNYQWYYFLFSENGASNFKKIFPSAFKGIEVVSSAEDVLSINLKAESFNFSIPVERIMYFLREGYFVVLEQESDYTIIEFFEPVVDVITKNSVDTIPLTTAKVKANDTTGIALVPHDYYNALNQKLGN